MSSPNNDEFHGWLASSPSAVDGNMKWSSFQPRAFQENTDIDIAVTHCAICHTDHAALGRQRNPDQYPFCVGHEIVGRVIRIGQNITRKDISLGDRVGIGGQCDACLNRHGRDCEQCRIGQENYCPEIVPTYGDYKNYDGSIAMGGYADKVRVNSHFVIPIPDGMDSAHAAPMLCGGITTYTPLVRYSCGPGKKVGIIGFGGLGHFAALWSKALGADKVLGISRSEGKRDDALALGCDEYLSTASGGYAEKAKEWEGSLDILVCTAASYDMDLNHYCSFLKTGGTFVLLGLPEGSDFRVPVMPMILKRIQVTASLIGSPREIQDMMNLAVEQNVKPWVEERDMKAANQAILDVGDGKPRYRLCLVNRDT